MTRLASRRHAALFLTAAVLITLAACGGQYPNSTFHDHSDINIDITALWDRLMLLATIVFVFVEGLLIFTIFKFRAKPGAPLPKPVHGSHTLEMIWTAIPVLILIPIAVPTVKTIFKTQAPAPANALKVEVYGHQWWWEFRYPEYNVVTANELYLPAGRTVSFTLRTQDVLHSFWISALSGKRDLISNHTNYLWFTPDSAQRDAWNGVCVEYCGASHANMRFKAFTVTPDEFQSWAAHQAGNAVFAAPAPAAPGAQANAQNVAQTRAGVPLQQPAGATVNPNQNLGTGGTKGPGETGRGPRVPSAGPPGAGVPNATQQPVTQVAQAGFTAFPRDSVPAYAVPHTPIPDGLTFDESLQGDATRGMQLLSTGQGGCLACHTIKGNPVMIGQVGPNLTHVGSRTTIAAGLYPNDTKHLALWIKNARVMKPGVLMPTLGLNQYDPILKAPMRTGGLSDQQIADIVAYLQALK